MTVRAIGNITGISTDYGAGNFSISYSVAVTGGSSDLSTSGAVQIPFTDLQPVADLAIRTAMAAKILSSFTLVILPIDIYIPFAVASV